MHWFKGRLLKAKTVKAALSDSHKIMVSVFKTSFKERKPKIVPYCDYKRFGNKEFRELFITCLSTEKNISYNAFKNLVLQTLAKMTPKAHQKQKVVHNFNTFYENIENTFKIGKDKQFLVEIKDVFDLVLKATKKYRAHLSIF